MALTIPKRLAASCAKIPERASWLRNVPHVIGGLRERWSLSLNEPFDGDEVSCAWVAAATRADGTPAVLKLGMPHFEGRHEIQALRFWDGNPTARVLEWDIDINAMLLERCEPGTRLRALPEPEQDIVIATLLKRLWRAPIRPHPFRPLSVLMDYWIAETLECAKEWTGNGLVPEGLGLLRELARNSSQEVLLATDLHAGNVLSARKQPWLVIDPKPFVGDPAYDATQHLLNCESRLQVDALGTIRRFADLLGVDSERVRLWTFARVAAEPRATWREDWRMALARAIAP